MGGDNSWRRIPASSDDLTPAQLVVLAEAWDGEGLPQVLHAWVPLSDAPYYNRRWKYVPEISAAAVSMLEFGFIDVRKSGQLLDADPLPFDEARAILLDPSNWWAFDPDDGYDPVETAQLAAAGVVEHDIPWYWIAETATAPPFPSQTDAVE